MSATTKAALIGAVIGVIAVGGVVAAVLTGAIALPSAPAQEKLLVVCAVQDEAGVDVVGVAFVVDGSNDSVTPLDPHAQGTVAGTSASNPREAFAFGGGAAAAKAFEPQTGDSDLPWVVLPSSTWSKALDDAGGIEVDVPSSVSSYSNGRLVLLTPGRARLSGEQVVALVESAPYLETDERDAVQREVTATMGTVLAGAGDLFARLVGDGAASSSLPAGEVPTF